MHPYKRIPSVWWDGLTKISKPEPRLSFYGCFRHRLSRTLIDESDQSHQSPQNHGRRGQTGESRRKITPSKDLTHYWWSWTTKSRSVLYKETGLWTGRERRGGRRWSESDTCLLIDVLWLRGGCWVAKGVAVDRSARDGMLSRSRLKLRESGVVPSGCLIQVTANTHNKSKLICSCHTTATWWIRRHFFFFCLRPALPVRPDVHAQLHSHRWPLTGVCQAGCSHKSKPAETVQVAKLVGSFSVCMKPISLSPGFICAAACSPLLLLLPLEKHSRRMCCLRFSVRGGQASSTKAKKMTGGWILIVWMMH